MRAEYAREANAFVSPPSRAGGLRLPVVLVQVEVAVAKSQCLPEPGARAAGEGERQPVMLVSGGQQAGKLAVVEDAPVALI